MIQHTHLHGQEGGVPATHGLLGLGEVSVTRLAASMARAQHVMQLVPHPVGVRHQLGIQNHQLSMQALRDVLLQVCVPAPYNQPKQPCEVEQRTKA